jgi:hypothetical protein
MSDIAITPESISDQKTEQASQSAQVSIQKKELNQQAAVEKQLIDGATARVLPEGVGAKLNTVA